MGTRTRYALWRKDGRLFIARGPDWPKTVEFSCSSQSELIEWAQNHGYMLRDASPQRRGA